MFNQIYNKTLQLSSVITGLGIAVIFFYCFFLIEFFPSELSIGETLLFIFSGLGFGIFYSFILSIFYFSIAHLATLSRSSLLTDLSVTLISIAFLLLPAIGLLIFDSTFESWIALSSFYVSGIILNIENIAKPRQTIFLTGNLKQEEEELEKRKIFIWVIGVLTPIILSQVTPSNLLKSTFTHLGIRSEQVTVLLDEENKNTLLQVSDLYETPLFSCKSGKYSTLQNVTVDWHGVGSLSQIRIEQKNNKKSLILPLKSKGVTIIKNLNIKENKRCILKTETIYFESSFSTPNQIGNQKLTTLISDIAKLKKNFKLIPKQVYLKGYSDIQPFKGKNMNNFALSLDRINYVQSKIKSHLHKNVPFELEPLGYYKKNNNEICHISQIKKYEKTCLSLSRSVEVIIQYESDSNLPENTKQKTNNTD